MRHRGRQLPYDRERKVRTREHVIADLSYNFLERKVLQRGHWLDAPNNDYGVDAIMFHHNDRGEIENGEVRFQLKATEHLPEGDAEFVPRQIDMKDLRYWYFEPYPFVLMLYEATRSIGLWLHIQNYVDKNPQIMDSGADSVTLRIPSSNKLTLNTIDRFRRLSLQTVASFQKRKSSE